MTQIHTYNSRARKRISRAVRITEQRLYGRRPDRQRRGGRAQQMTFAVAQEDIEHQSFGDVRLASAVTMDSPKGTTGDDISIFNPGSMIWEGSELLLVRATLAGVTDQADGIRWAVVQAWSATRIRGTATAAIAAGATGTINNIETINGHYAPVGGTATVYLPTAFVDVENGVVVWAELAWRDTLLASRWEAYSADCTGGA